MKSRVLIFAFIGVALFITSIPDSESLRAVLELDEMIKSSDIIVIGTVQSTWVDIRPFNEHKIVDTAEIKIDEWLKNDKNSDTLEIRYYGYWAKTIENLVGIHRMDIPTHKYETGQKVLILVNYENPTMVMGEGYYPFYEGSFVINDDVTISQTDEQTTLHQLNTVINRVVNDEIAQLDCFLTEYWDGTKCVPLDFETSVEPEQYKTHSGLGLLNQNEQKYVEEKIPLSTSDEVLKSKAYIVNCDETLYKEELPDLTIENSTHNYDLQYCKWELKYPDLTLISDTYLLNDYPYCAELFDTLFDYYQSIRDDCGMQRYNKDGTPRGICEPAPAGAGVPYDVNMIKSGCSDNYADWAYMTKHNDDVFYLFDR